MPLDAENGAKNNFWVPKVIFRIISEKNTLAKLNFTLANHKNSLAYNELILGQIMW